MLAVDPKSQGKGVGSMLVNWGAELADQMGLDVSFPFPSPIN